MRERVELKGILMTYIKFLLILLVFAAFIPLAHSQEDFYILNHKILGKHQRPPVVFDHKFHSEKIDCLRCHHDFDAYGNNRGGEGQSCDSCHKKEADEDQPSLVDAFHWKCKGCHENMKAGPVACGECHVRKKK